MNAPPLVPLTVVAAAVAHAIGPYCDHDGVAAACAANAVQAMIGADDDASPQVAIADALFAQRGHVRHIVKAAVKGAEAYLVAERPTITMRYQMLEQLGVRDPYEWLKAHGLMERASGVRAVANA